MDCNWRESGLEAGSVLGNCPSRSSDGSDAQVAAQKEGRHACLSAGPFRDRARSGRTQPPGPGDPFDPPLGDERARTFCGRVVFEPLPLGTNYTAGKISPSILLSCGIRAGRSHEVRQRIIRRCYELLADVTQAPPDQIFVTVRWSPGARRACCDAAASG